MKVAEVQVPACGVFSFPMAHPEGRRPRAVLVGSSLTRLRRMTDRVVLVEGTGTPGTNSVDVYDNPDHDQATPDSLSYKHSLVAGATIYPLPPGLPKTTITTPEGIRFTIFRDFIGENVHFSVEVANAEWGHLYAGYVEGPVKIPQFSITHGQTPLYLAPQSLAGKTLNPREHTFILFASGPKKDAMQRFEHMVQCTGEYSYQNQEAWGPQQSRVLKPENTIPDTPVRAAPIAGSPLTPMGMPDGNETGGSLIEVAVLPGADTPEATAWLFDVMKCVMDREPVWAFADEFGAVCDDKTMAGKYDGEIPYRAADTNRADKMMPEFFSGKWVNDNPKVNHRYKAHDGQHFVRATCTPKSVFWNTGSMLAQHCIAQLSAHIRLCRTAYPVKDAGWGYEESVYDMLNRSKPEHRGVGRGVGRREDAWGLEVQVMDMMINGSEGTQNWLRNNAVVISDNILPTGVGAMTAPNVVWQFLSHYTARPPMSDIQDGCGYHQMIEVCHYSYALFCLSRIAEFKTLAEPLVVKCSDLVATSHFKWDPHSTTMAGPWYLQVRDPDGTVVTNITRGQGKYQENWNAMILHSNALRINPAGRHDEYLRQVYGENLDQIPVNAKYEKGRVAMMSAAVASAVEPVEDPITPVDDPIVIVDPEPVVTRAELQARIDELEQQLTEARAAQQEAEDAIDSVLADLTESVQQHNDALEGIHAENVLRKNAERELNILKQSFEKMEKGAMNSLAEAARWKEDYDILLRRIKNLLQ